ncbi:MAG TPA: D-serine ammonia-lyase [Candidatus Ventrimonas merdavium]|nr:D-serine ammonia-lyase [Candidatus Ventrimonas merdavium]
MQNKEILGKSLESWKQEFPILKDLAALKETAWRNPDKRPIQEAAAGCPLTMADVEDASRRLDRFAAFFQAAFPETAASGGILESPLQEIPSMKAALEQEQACPIPGRLWIKLDSHLPISGSIKARGGIYEVLKTAEDIALEAGLLQLQDDYSILTTKPFQELFSRYSICVGSTGNLGLSIGIISAKLGFRVTVHMSSDARQWKKELLRSKGVTVREYDSDYSAAVAQGRKAAEGNPYCHFVDDENSRTLFLGYSVAALRLKKQLEENRIIVDEEHPLFVYLPCGVGGGPGGVAFGLKLVFGDHAHCFFAEPTHSCCMLLGMATGENSRLSVQDFGIDNRTVADGLAVGRASGFVGSLMRPFISGCYTLSDQRMYHMLSQLADTEGLYLEPSALAGMYGPLLLTRSPAFQEYIRQSDPDRKYLSQGSPNQGDQPQQTTPTWLSDSTQLVWATGGSMVPQQEMEAYYQKGKAC